MIRAYLINPITIKALVSRDEWQEPAWKLVSTMARVDWGSRLVRNLKGEQVISSALIYLSPDIKAIAHDDRIIIDGVEHLIVRIEEKADFKFDHWEIYIQ